MTLCVGLIAVFFIFGYIAMLRAAGVIILVQSMYSLINDPSIEFGIEGMDEPSYRATGWSAVVIRIPLILLSLFLIFYAQDIAGWV